MKHLMISRDFLNIKWDDYDEMASTETNTHWAPTSWAIRNREATAPASLSNQDIPSEKSLETAIFSILSSYFFQNQDQAYSSILQLIFPAFSSISPLFSRYIWCSNSPAHKKKNNQRIHPINISIACIARPGPGGPGGAGRLWLTNSLGSCQKGTDLVIFRRKSPDLIMENDEVRKWWSTPVILYGANHWAKLVSFLEFTSI